MTAPIPRPTPASHITHTEYWSITDSDGKEISLHQYQWNVTTKGGSRYDMPTRRGSNRLFPYRPGTRHNLNKFADERVIVLDMWINARAPGTRYFPADPNLQWNDSWNFIRHLVWRFNGAQFWLTRRWWLTVDGVAKLHKASALVEVVDSMPPTMQGPHMATFQMTLVMSSPYFYGDWQEVTLDSGDTLSVINTGDDRAMYEHFSVKMTGRLLNPVLTNQTTSPEVWLKYDDNIFTNVLFNVPDFLAFDASNNNVIRKVIHSGARFWFGLNPGPNLIKFADSYTGTKGTCTIRWRPPYI